MATQTTNYNLTKPIKATENVDIDVINTNMDLIDKALSKVDPNKNTAVKTTPIDGDSVTLTDSADGNKLKKLTWENLKAALKIFLNEIYVEKVTGKSLTSNDFTDALKIKLDGIDTGATKTIIDAALSDTSNNPVQNKAVNAGFAQKGNTQTYIITDTATLTVPVASWVANTNTQAEAQEKTDFPFMATIPIAANLVGGKAVSTEDGGRVDPKYADQISGNYCLNSYTVDGGVLVECVAKPTAPLVLNYIEIIRRLS